MHLKESKLHLNHAVTKILSNMFSEPNSDYVTDNQSHSPDKCSIDESKSSYQKVSKKNWV